MDYELLLKLYVAKEMRIATLETQIQALQNKLQKFEAENAEPKEKAKEG
jgi:uncharacterized coiled-coil protein SlyX